MAECRPHDGRVSGKLFPGGLGHGHGGAEEFWHPGGDLRGRVRVGGCVAGVGEEVEVVEWAAEIQDDLVGGRGVWAGGLGLGGSVGGGVYIACMDDDGIYEKERRSRLGGLCCILEIERLLP